MKPIFFNTEMVCGLLAGTKTVTRRVVKPQPRGHAALLTSNLLPETTEAGVGAVYAFEDGTVTSPPYRPGDILYVRETWCQVAKTIFWYRADCPAELRNILWRPSIHMPREAARIFLRVKNVRVERLQDSFFNHGSMIFSLLREGIDIGEQCRECIDAYGSPCCIDSESECGVLDEVRNEFADLWDRCYAAPRPVMGAGGTIDHYESYPWEDIQETRTYKGKPWYVIGNPWTWVIEFERCDKPAEVREAKR